MAAAEVNTNASLLPDATVAVTSVSLPLFDADPAAFYDLAVDLCDNGGYHAYFSSVLDNMAFATSLVCPNPDLATHLLTAGPAAGSFPLFQRQIESMTQDLQIMIAQFKYFGWTRTAILFNTNDVWIKTARNARQMFSQNGISVLASIQMAEYDPSISTMYYPQIQNVFEFLKSTRLRIFFALVDQVADVMMAANRTGIAGRDYGD
nr:hypothetical protein HK105_005004 [Polyrhizophydium stewartii]